MRKRAQAAMEFLMTYGWAILVVLIAIGALAYFGVLSPEQFLPEKCVISTGSGLFCDDFTITNPDLVTLNLHNILSDQMDGVTVTLVNGAGGTGTCVSSAISIGADATVPLNLTCESAGYTNLSEKVKGDLTIAYTVNAFAKTTSGQLVGKTP
jgi:hypothetical protein